MEITVDRLPFLEAFALVAGVAPARSPKPILRDVKLVAGPDGCWLEATDLEVAIRRDLDGVVVDRPGRVILPKMRVAQILGASADATLDFRVDADRLLRVVGDRAEIKLQTEDPDLFPGFPDAPAAPGRTVAAGDLRTLIRRTIFACDVDSTRYALGGCLVELGDSTVALVATDGRRLARMVAAATADESPSPAESPASGVIPQRALKLIDRSFAGEGPVRLAIDDKAAHVRGDRTRIYSRLVEGRFPRYRDVFPATQGVPAGLEVGTFRRAIEQAAVATAEESRGIDFAFEPGLVRLSGTCADVGSSRVELEIAHDGPAMTVVFDVRYLLDALKPLDDALPLECRLIDGKSPVLFGLEDGYQYVVMPLTRDR